MSKKSLPTVLFVLLALAGASSATAVLRCDDCADFCCSHGCVTDSGPSTCGDSGPSCLSCRVSGDEGDETLLAQIFAPAASADAPATTPAAEAPRCSTSE
jgi:hypothetical protein